MNSCPDCGYVRGVKPEHRKGCSYTWSDPPMTMREASRVLESANPVSADVICEWFFGCHNEADGTLDHSTLGAVNACAIHKAWRERIGNTGDMPPIVAARLRAMTPEQRNAVIGS